MLLIAILALTPYTRVLHPPIEEMSGMVKSRQYSNTYWVHNDSGDSARLFAIREDGTVIWPGFLADHFFVDKPQEGKKPFAGLPVDGASNSDWEDIAIDGETLYIADMGNNGNARRDLAVYELPEPNPSAVLTAHYLKRYPIAYPEQKKFPPPSYEYDCEAIFVVRHQLYFLTKHRLRNNQFFPLDSTHLYRLTTRYTDRINLLQRVDVRERLGGWVTAADVSPDGKTLAVLCQTPVACVWFFKIPAKGDRFLREPIKQIALSNVNQCESLCWKDNRTLLIGNEQRELFRLDKSSP